MDTKIEDKILKAIEENTQILKKVICENASLLRV